MLPTNDPATVSRISPESNSPVGDLAEEESAYPGVRPMRRSLAGRPHLTAILVIAGLLAGLVVAVEICVDRLETNYVHTVLAADKEYHSLRSLATERCALRQADLLPVYGSSELIKPVPGRATVFFRTYPTGFSVFPIGKAGTYPLIMLQHIASMGKELRGRKIAISISAGWFRENDLVPDQYRGNFLLPTAREFLFSTAVSYDLRQATARRILRFPETLEGDPVADFAAHHLAAGSWSDHLAYWSAWPLGRLQIFISRCQDHFEVAMQALGLLFQHVAVQRVPTEIDWPKLRKAATQEAQKHASHEIDPHIPSAQAHEADAQFLASLRDAPVWGDFDLLLRSLQEVGARPLLLCTPLNGRALSKDGISRAARDVFYRRLAEAVAPYHFPLLQFADHDSDDDFVYDRNDHLSERGWIYYNQALDAFVHDRTAAGSNSTEDRH